MHTETGKIFTQWPLLVKKYYPTLAVTETPELNTIQRQSCYLQITYRKATPVGNLFLEGDIVYVPQSLILPGDVGYTMYANLREDIVHNRKKLSIHCESNLRPIHIGNEFSAFLNEEYYLFLISKIEKTA